jgi:hypothetical protein
MCVQPKGLVITDKELRKLLVTIVAHGVISVFGLALGYGYYLYYLETAATKFRQQGGYVE